MNEHELDLALGAIGASRTQVTAPTALRERVHTVPRQAPQRRSWLPHSPKWRFQSMFSATKFVVAGAIVALFGGFLLSGVLTQQGEEQVPVVGASASASAELTEATTVEPEPTMAIEAEMTTRSDLLPGVDLVTEEVETGVFRVLSDGVRDLSKRVNDVAVTSGGDAWVVRGAPGDWSIVRLGEPSVARKLGGKPPWWIGLTADDAVVVQKSGRPTRMFDGETWVEAEPSLFDMCVVGSGVLGPDGGCWEMEGFRPARIDPDGSRTVPTPDETGLEPGFKVGSFPKLGPDGTVWYQVWRETGTGAVFEGLLAYDGSTWLFTSYDGDDVADHDGYIGVDADGVVWVGRLVSHPHPAVLRWDGASWTSHMAGTDPGAHVWPWPNGIVWLNETATRWDGTTLRVVEPEIRVHASWYTAGGPFGTAPDGSVWLALDGALYVITPEAVAAAE